MPDESRFEGRLAASLEAYAGPRRPIDAAAIVRAAAQVEVRASARARVAARLGLDDRISGGRWEGLLPGRGPARFVAVLAVLIVILSLGGLVVGSALVRLPVIAPSPSATPPSTQPSTIIRPPSAAIWSATGSLLESRTSHSATLLRDGRVLVAGGTHDKNGATQLATAELYDPASGSWTGTGKMIDARQWHTATLLPDGSVLVAGGVAQDGVTASAERYEAGSGTWKAAGAMTEGRYLHTATVLADGRVLVAGGLFAGRGALRSAELYDPTAGTWTVTGSMAEGRFGHTATLLPDGKVLVAGGDGPGGVRTTAELFDPSTGAWSPTGRMVIGRHLHSATLLPNGTVLVAGGVPPHASVTGRIEASAEIYDPTSGSWTATGSMAQERAGHTATLLLDGKVLVAGGDGPSVGRLASAEVFDPSTGTWAATDGMETGRIGQTATLLDDGDVLIAGGTSGADDFLASAELYEPGGTH
jgi:hypothetical protein